MQASVTLYPSPDKLYADLGQHEPIVNEIKMRVLLL